MQHGNKIVRFVLYAGFALYALASCNKTAYNPQSFPIHPAAPVDTLHNLRHMIDSVPNSGLFLLALQRTGYDSLLSQTGAFYTLVIPTDSLLIASGYTKDVITYLKPSILLTGIIVNQFWNGQISDSALDGADGYVTVTSIPDPSNVGQLNNYAVAKQGGPAGGLWINGVQVSHEKSGIRASNGYIHTANAFYTPPASNAWTTLQSRPEFSYFVAACRINDSVVNAVGQSYRNSYYLGPDTVMFEGGQQFGPGNWPTANFTYFVPTNQAFINAGFNTIDDIRNYALTYTNDPNGILMSPLDSIILGHWMPFSNLYYFNLLKNPNLNTREAADLKQTLETTLYDICYFVNTGILLGYQNQPGLNYGLVYPYKGVLNFQVSDTTVTITCNSARHPPAATLVEHDILCSYSMILHGVDHLFWPY